MILSVLLGACVPTAPIPEAATRIATAPDAILPPMKTFAARRVPSGTTSNADLVRDFLDLSFTLESGRPLESFTRFETPVGVRLTGPAGAAMRSDLARLLSRLRDEAGIDIAATERRDAQITVQVVRRSDIRRHLPQAACFVVPNVSSLAEYADKRHAPDVSWSKLTERSRAAIFVPGDTSPQEARDCLHEELAQALGPLNDLYRLPESVFNDDNVHNVLTGHDMTILRAYYDPALRSGMTREKVGARLPGILARLNPAGEGVPPTGLADTPRDWTEAVQTALAPGPSAEEKRRAARRALHIAASLEPDDHRRGFSHYAMGRTLQRRAPDAARSHFEAADRIFATSARTALHRAYVAPHLAQDALSAGRTEAALAWIRPARVVAERHENAALLATLMLLEAEALELSGRAAEARAVRLDSLGWARYGFGSDWAVQAKTRDAASLTPAQGGVVRP
ncbi:hypothetical protein OCH239_03040 [Roseivivax halodurans JCM 10272]|uniref:ATP-dependent transcriptional regulator n=1 Tax=Roseivivax halodurans JCM 10272 TaxID=1449350 RepID=X7EF46_9RHOB|nr:DUF2927 domain-containing protein [Roseivivax halodurans]ETX14552.1 hypothetical protein OCH239_03040 [Roseivivax halodurans JCM 10272]